MESKTSNMVRVEPSEAWFDIRGGRLEQVDKIRFNVYNVAGRRIRYKFFTDSELFKIEPETGFVDKGGHVDVLVKLLHLPDGFLAAPTTHIIVLKGRFASDDDHYRVKPWDDDDDDGEFHLLQIKCRSLASHGSGGQRGGQVATPHQSTNINAQSSTAPSVMSMSAPKTSSKKERSSKKRSSKKKKSSPKKGSSKKKSSSKKGSSKKKSSKKGSSTKGARGSPKTKSPSAKSPTAKSQSSIEAPTTTSPSNKSPSAASPSSGQEPEKTTYTVAVKTSDVQDASTDASAYVQLTGEKGVGPQMHLTTSLNHRNKFERKRSDVFVYHLQKPLGPLKQIKVWHDNSGVSPGWHLDAVEVNDSSAGISYAFPCNQWLCKKEGDKQISRVLKCARTKEKQPKQLRVAAEILKEQEQTQNGQGQPQEGEHQLPQQDPGQNGRPHPGGQEWAPQQPSRQQDPKYQSPAPPRSSGQGSKSAKEAAARNTADL